MKFRKGRRKGESYWSFAFPLPLPSPRISFLLFGSFDAPFFFFPISLCTWMSCKNVESLQVTAALAYLSRGVNYWLDPCVPYRLRWLLHSLHSNMCAICNKPQLPESCPGSKGEWRQITNLNGEGDFYQEKFLTTTFALGLQPSSVPWQNIAATATLRNLLNCTISRNRHAGL